MKGAAIGNAPNALITMKNNRFINNFGGVPVFLHGELLSILHSLCEMNVELNLCSSLIKIDGFYKDLGGNLAESNYDCNGLWIERGGSKCVVFQLILRPSHLPSSMPSTPKITTSAPRGGVGYYNYDINDDEYGPKSGGWGDVKDSYEFQRYKELSGTLKRSFINKCDWKHVNQSPIDLCEDKINSDCQEYHQTRTRVRKFCCIIFPSLNLKFHPMLIIENTIFDNSQSGNISLGDKHVTAQILPR